MSPTSYFPVGYTTKSKPVLPKEIMRIVRVNLLIYMGITSFDILCKNLFAKKLSDLVETFIYFYQIPNVKMLKFEQNWTTFC